MPAKMNWRMASITITIPLVKKADLWKYVCTKMTLLIRERKQPYSVFL